MARRAPAEPKMTPWQPEAPSSEHWRKIDSTDGLERLNGEPNETHVAVIFPNDKVIVRRVVDILLEQSGKWAVDRARYMWVKKPGHLQR
jgi:transposase-like protein